MASTMKAALIRAFGKPLEIARLPIPKIGAHECLVNIHYSGICGTDYHAWKGDWNVPPPKLPLIPGHEGVGRVVEVGRNVTAVKKGDIVGVPWVYTACGHCEHCFSGWDPLCPTHEKSGYTVNGTLAEYVVADPNYVAHIPENVDLARVAPIMCAGLTVYKGLKMTEAKAGSWVLVSGLGGLGQLGVQFAKAMGFNVIGVDIDDQKLETAKRLGATYAFNGKQDVASEVHKVTGGVHGAIVTSSGLSAYHQTLSTMRPRGTLVMLGVPPGAFPLEVFNTVIGAITVRGSVVGSRMDMLEALEFFKRGDIHNEIIIDKIESINSILETMDKGALPGRVVFDFTS